MNWKESNDLYLNTTTSTPMLRYAIIFFVIALIAGALGAGGVAGLSMNIAYILAVIGLILLVIHFVTGRGRV